MTSFESRVLVRRYFELLSGGAVSDAPSILADDFVFCHPPLTAADGVRGRDAFLANVLGPTRRAFPDMFFTVADVIIDADRACARWDMLATHNETYLGVPATHTRVRAIGINIFHIVDGRIEATWVARDNFGLLRQLKGG